MSLFSLFKRNSRLAMRSSWGRAALILLMMIGVSVLLSLLLLIAVYGLNGGMPPSNPTMEQLELLEGRLPALLGVQAFSLLFSILIIAPLSLGMVSWYLSVVRASPEPFSGIFFFYEKPRRYGRAVLYAINMALRTFLWAVAFFTLPSAVLGATIVFTGQYAQGGNRQLAVFSALGMMLAFFLLLLALVLYLAYMNKYFLVPYLLASDDNLTVREAIGKSALLTSGYRFSLLWYMLSFLGWQLLAALFFPIVFYAVPYMSAAYAMYALYLIERPREAIASDEHTREFSATPPQGIPPQEASPPPDIPADERTMQLPDMAEEKAPDNDAVIRWEQDEENPGEKPGGQDGKWPYV